MKKKNLKFLKTLLETPSPTGSEVPVANLVRERLADTADEIETNVMGSVHARLSGRGAGPTLMLAAHMDHIGFIATDADKEGYVRVYNVGGIDVSVSLGQHVVFENGVKGVVGAEEDIEGAPKMQNLYVDIGASTREEALEKVAIGDVAVYAPVISELGAMRLASPAMDDRAGCAVLAEAFMQMKETKNEVVAVFTVQEEVGLRGARTAAYAVDPDYAIALDVTTTGDVPEPKPKMAVKLGAGAAIKVMDRSVICAPAVRDRLVKLSQAQAIPYQMEVLTAGGTDSGAIHQSRGGVPSGVISIPCRYVHSAAETVDLQDMEAAVKMLVAYVNEEL